MFISLFFFPLLFFLPYCLNYVRMEDTWWIEYIVATPPFLTNFRVDMTSFMDIHKVVVERSAFWTFFKGMKWKWIKRWGKQWRVETSIFTSGKGFESTRNVWTNSHSKKKHQGKKTILVSCAYVHPLCVKKTKKNEL